VTFAPAKSVISFAGISKMFTVKGGKAVEARVTTGAKRGDWVEIVSGLKGEQQVVAEGADKLANGIPVKMEGRQAVESATRPAVAESK
jgi:multidrug efflux pump subunit AcrA (membrane-fusion protein)